MVERTGQVIHLCFNRPKTLNSIDVSMANALQDALHGISKDSSVRAVILSGAGRCFMAGGDLATLRADPLQGSANLLKPLNDALVAMATINAPVIAQVHGVAAGAGLSLMLQADYVLASHDTRFNLAYINLGASCDVGASWALPRLVGLRKALEISLLGDDMSCEEAVSLGLVNRAVPTELLEMEVSSMANRFAAGPTLAYGAMKRLMHASFERDLRSQLTHEATEFANCTQTEDFKIGIEGFYAKCKPRFIGL